MLPGPLSPAVHPLGEGHSPADVTPPEVVTVSTPKGPVSIAWEAGTSSSAHGLGVFFIQFLHESGLWEAFCARCPLTRTSPNAPSLATVLGSLLLTILSGANRYRHVEAIRGDTVLPQLLGMDRILSTDAMLRAVKVLAADDRGQAWVADLLLESLLPVVSKAPWILDLDSTVVTVYGKQGGSAVGYNPTKKGRPSYSYHSFLIGGLRLPLDVEARPGNESHGVHGAEALWRLLDHRLPAAGQPWCIRGDISYGNETIISGCEDRRRDFLFKLRRSHGVKAIIDAPDTGEHTWVDAGQGWHGRELQARLGTWTNERRAIVLRRPLDHLKTPVIGGHQTTICAAELCPHDGHEYAVLVTSLKHPIATIAQFYRDRADCENTFADLKNDWAWGGFTTQDQGRNQLMARLVALVYTWWNIFVRQISPLAHREGHVSRPLLLHGIARTTTHGRTTTVHLISHHAKAAQIIAALNATVTRIKDLAAASAKQLAAGLRPNRWTAIIEAIFEPLLRANVGPPQAIGG
jgi:hypothetical protein